MNLPHDTERLEYADSVDVYEKVSHTVLDERPNAQTNRREEPQATDPSARDVGNANIGTCERDR